MPNIKEIALKVAGELDDRLGLGARTRGDWPTLFAEAIVAELSKVNEPVGYVDYGDRVEWYGTKPSPETDLYTLPPTASQIEQETAEACAKLCHDLYKDLNGDADCRKHWPRQLETNKTYAKAIRSGAWKEFKQS